MADALALAFNKAGGSMQSNIDGSLAVRVIQGFTSQSGIIARSTRTERHHRSEEFSRRHIRLLPPLRKDNYAIEAVTGELGKRFEMEKTLFKRFPSCGGTLAPTDAVLALVSQKQFTAEEIARVDVRVSPHVYKLVGGLFEIGENPKVNAQFNIQYCVANALLRKSSKLVHFDEADIRDPRIMDLVKRIHISPEPSLDDPTSAKFSIAAHVKVTTKSGAVYDTKSADIPRGHPGNPLSREEHMERLRDCLDYAGNPLPSGAVKKMLAIVERLEETEDIRALIPLLSVKRKRK